MSNLVSEHPTVAEVIKELKKFPPDMRVYTGWEGIYGSFGYPVIEKHSFLNKDIVYIDAEYGSWYEEDKL